MKTRPFFVLPAALDRAGSADGMSGGKDAEAEHMVQELAAVGVAAAAGGTPWRAISGIGIPDGG